MNRKIIGVTVGTPISPARVDRELKPVKTVNGVAPDENGNVEVEAGSVDVSNYYTKDEIDDKIGDIEAALDNIIAIQSIFIGGEGV